MICHARRVTAALAGALFFAAIVSVAISHPETALGADPTYREELALQAERLGLHEERPWRVLLHYTDGISAGTKSKITDPSFFLAPAGRTDPRAELQATLEGFFLPAQKDGEHAACRFPARYQWLAERLGIDPARLPAYRCSERDTLFETVDPRSAVLVFPVGHINSPASMFGHTLLRIDGSSQSNLISYAANYAATTTDSNGFVYAWKGIFGMYRGYFSLTPYYLKVKEYADLEHRDMWEYRLRLSEPEVRRMLAHIWELQNVASDYYFFDENCSYNLLFLIEAARPKLKLVEQTGVAVIPSSTIAIAQQNGILDRAVYRPSQGTKIRHLFSQLGPKEREQAYRVARAQTDPAQIAALDLPASKKRTTLQLAAEYLQFRYARNELEKPDYSRLYLKILSQRSLMGQAEPGRDEPPEPSGPEEGHGTARIAAGGGLRRGEPYLELALQPAFHTLLDPDQGYLKGAQIRFLDSSFLYNLKTDKLQLKRLHLLDIVSLAPRDLFFQPLSWKVNTGLDREPMRDGKDATIFRLNTGGGLAYADHFGGIGYFLAELDLNAGERIRGKATLGPGLTVGTLQQIGSWWKLHLYGRGFVYRVGDDRYTVQGVLAQNFRLNRQNSLNLELSRQYVNRHGISELNLLWNHYF